MSHWFVSAGRKDARKKLSWIYRKKAKLEKNKNLESNATNDKNTDNTNARIIARNLPFSVYIYIYFLFMLYALITSTY